MTPSLESENSICMRPPPALLEDLRNKATIAVRSCTQQPGKVRESQRGEVTRATKRARTQQRTGWASTLQCHSECYKV